MTVREAYVAAARAAVDLLGRREVGDSWASPSSLAEFDVGGLAGHLARAVLQVEWYLDAPAPDGPVLSAAEYYAAASGGVDPSSAVNVGIRARAAETAAGGWARLYLDAGKAIDRLAERLPTEPPDRRVDATGRTLVLDEYLKSRLIELCFHIDDLARSLSLPPPSLPAEATTHAIAVLVGAARLRHGDLAILHALGRRELDTVQALRVL
ncbi:MAG: hypothetical protein QOF60_1355 [Actinomycetota bacterium]|nr:hypothetical protein [Actinomycetota bacterium]